MANHHKLHGKHYALAFIALLVLTLASWGLSYAPLGAVGPVVALGIAGIKVLIVMLIFMHLWEAPFATQMVVVTLGLFIALICFGLIADVAAR